MYEEHADLYDFFTREVTALGWTTYITAHTCACGCCTRRRVCTLTRVDGEETHRFDLSAPMSWLADQPHHYPLDQLLRAQILDLITP